MSTQETVEATNSTRTQAIVQEGSTPTQGTIQENPMRTQPTIQEDQTATRDAPINAIQSDENALAASASTEIEPAAVEEKSPIIVEQNVQEKQEKLEKLEVIKTEAEEKREVEEKLNRLIAGILLDSPREEEIKRSVEEPQPTVSVEEPTSSAERKEKFPFIRRCINSRMNVVHCARLRKARMRANVLPLDVKLRIGVILHFVLVGENAIQLRRLQEQVVEKARWVLETLNKGFMNAVFPDGLSKWRNAPLLVSNPRHKETWEQYTSRFAAANIEFTLIDTPKIARLTPNSIQLTDDTKYWDDLLKRRVSKPINPRHYYNIWVVLGIPVPPFLGYGSFPKVNPSDADIEVDGCVIFDAPYPYNLGKTFMHEGAHVFALQHTFDEPQQGTYTDGIEDTPYQTHPDYGAPLLEKTWPSSVNPDTKLPEFHMIHNYLNYTEDDHMIGFTKGQIQRMRETLTSTRVSWLLNSQQWGMVTGDVVMPSMSTKPGLSMPFLPATTPFLVPPYLGPPAPSTLSAPAPMLTLTPFSTAPIQSPAFHPMMSPFKPDSLHGGYGGHGGYAHGHGGHAQGDGVKKGGADWPTSDVLPSSFSTWPPTKATSPWASAWPNVSQVTQQPLLPYKAPVNPQVNPPVIAYPVQLPVHSVPSSSVVPSPITSTPSSDSGPSWAVFPPPKPSVVVTKAGPESLPPITSLLSQVTTAFGAFNMADSFSKFKTAPSPASSAMGTQPNSIGTKVFGQDWPWFCNSVVAASKNVC